MFRLEQIGPYRSDATAPYFVILEREYTIKEFISEVLSRTKEWGYIYIPYHPHMRYQCIPICEYRCGKLLNDIQEDILGRKIILAHAEGGWGRTDYYLTI